MTQRTRNFLRRHGWALMIWQAWKDAQCQVLGHEQIPDTCHCRRCHRFFMQWYIDCAACKLAQTLDKEIEDKVFNGELS